MKELTCEICDRPTPYTDLKRGKLNDLLACVDCRAANETAFEFNAGEKEAADEMWLSVDSEGLTI